MQARRWLITVVICLLVMAGLGTYKWLQIRAAIAVAASYPEPSETVEAVLSEQQPVQHRIATIGEIVAPQMVALRNEIEGRISAVNFESGSIVKQGQVLLQLDISEETARLQSAQASVRLARLDLQRVEKLLKNQTVSEERLDQARAQFEISTANVQTQQAIIDKKTLRAPFDAYVGLHSFEPGELLAANTLITTLVGVNNDLWVDFNLPYQQADVAIGTEVDVEVTSGNGAEIVTAKVIARDSALSVDSRNLRLRAAFRPGQPIPPNTVVNISVPVAEATTLVKVPATAINRDGLGSFVYVLESHGDGSYRARRRAVEPGSEVLNPQLFAASPKGAESRPVSLLSGLDAGELVAANGAFKLRDGLRVYVKKRPSSNGSDQ